MKQNRYRYDIRCSDCGKFIKAGQWEVSTSYGSYNGTEPPNDDFICLDCVEKSVQHYIEQKWIPAEWHKPRWHYRVAKAIGFVLAGIKGNAWNSWFPADKIPEGYEIIWDSRTDEIPSIEKKENFAIRLVQDGTVEINGKIYRPNETHQRYNGKLDGWWMAFGLYDNEDYISCWGSASNYYWNYKEDHRNKQLNELQELLVRFDPQAVNGTHPWEWWDVVKENGDKENGH